jgi:hypothetical protein
MARKIPLKTLDMGQYGPQFEGGLKYSEMLLGVLRQGQQSGFSADELISIMAVIEPIKKADADGEDCVILEDAQYTTLRGRLDAFRFSLAHEAMVQFIGDVRGAETVQIAEAKAAGSKK